MPIVGRALIYEYVFHSQCTTTYQQQQKRLNNGSVWQYLYFYLFLLQYGFEQETVFTCDNLVKNDH
jgi:hypothetical protein